MAPAIDFTDPTDPIDPTVLSRCKNTKSLQQGVCAGNPTWEPRQGSVPACSPQRAGTERGTQCYGVGWLWGCLGPGQMRAQGQGFSSLRGLSVAHQRLWNCREPKELQRPRHSCHQLGLLGGRSSLHPPWRESGHGWQGHWWHSQPALGTPGCLAGCFYEHCQVLISRIS